MTVHFDDDNNGAASMCHTDYIGVDFSQDFHIFSVTWEKNKIEWFVDGVLKRTDYRYYTIHGQPIGCQVNEAQYYIKNKIFPTNPMSIILNFAIENGSNSPDNSTPFPSQMEIDWVKYYQKNPCQDIYISNSSQFLINNNVFNAIVGQNISIDCNYIISADQQLDVISKNSITLKSGFLSEIGSTFLARTESSVCNSELENDGFVTNDASLILKNDKTSTINEIIPNDFSSIKIIPNPSYGSFVIESLISDHNKFNLKILNHIGNTVYTQEKINSPSIEINIGNYAKGIYFLYITDNETIIFTEKLIIQ